MLQFWIKKNYRHNNRLYCYHIFSSIKQPKILYWFYTSLFDFFPLFEKALRGIFFLFMVFGCKTEVGKWVFTIMLQFLLLVFSAGILIWLGHLRIGKEFLLQVMDVSARRLWPQHSPKFCFLHEKQILLFELLIPEGKKKTPYLVQIFLKGIQEP